MDILPKELDEAAEICANNHSKFNDFGWHGRHDYDHPEKWFMYYTKNRDSNLVAKSNDSVLRKHLTPFGPDYVRTERHGHWGHGWADCLVIKVYEDNGDITEAFKVWHEFAMVLSWSNTLDDSDLSDRKYEHALYMIRYSNIDVEDPNHCYRKSAVDGSPMYWESEVFDWLYKNIPSALEDQDDMGATPDKKDILKALDALKIAYEKEDEDEV